MDFIYEKYVFGWSGWREVFVLIVDLMFSRVSLISKMIYGCGLEILARKLSAYFWRDLSLIP